MKLWLAFIFCVVLQIDADEITSTTDGVHEYKEVCLKASESDDYFQTLRVLLFTKMLLK